MELKIKNFKVPETQMEHNPMQYKLSKDSIIPLLREICGSDAKFSIRDFENGISVSFWVDGLTDENNYGEEVDLEPDELATLYIFDSGEIDYVHRGFRFSGLYVYTAPVKNFYQEKCDGMEYDTKELVEELDKNLGSEYVYGEEKGNTITSKIIKHKNDRLREMVSKKRKALLAAVLSAIKTYNYSENKVEINPGSQSMGM